MLSKLLLLNLYEEVWKTIKKYLSYLCINISKSIIILTFFVGYLR